MPNEPKLKPKEIKAIESVLAKGYCAEVRPTKDSIKVIQVIRKQVNNEPSP